MRWQRVTLALLCLPQVVALSGRVAWTMLVTIAHVKDLREGDSVRVTCVLHFSGRRPAPHGARGGEIGLFTRVSEARP